MSDQGKTTPAANFLKTIAEGTLTDEQLDQLASILAEKVTERPPVKKIRRTPQEVRELPAMYVDSCWITYWEGHIRVAFSESVAGEDIYRNAIILQVRDATTIANRILRIIAEMDAEDDAEGDNAS